MFLISETQWILPLAFLAQVITKMNIHWFNFFSSNILFTKGESAKNSPVILYINILGNIEEMSHLKLMNSSSRMSWKIECVTWRCREGVGRNEAVAQSSPIRRISDSFTPVQVTDTLLFCLDYSFVSSET